MTTPEPTTTEPETAPTASEGIDRSALQHVATLLPGWLEDVRARSRQSGLQAAIWYDGELICEVAVGSADLSGEVPLRSDHRLRIASHSKMFTALAIMRLLEEGRLRLDDTVGERVAELEGSAVADRTIRDLLSHSAGISRDSSDSRWWQLEIPFPDRARMLEIAREDAAVCEPGLHLQYSNIGYGILGLIIEDVTGATFSEAVTELVLDPVGCSPIGPDRPADAPGPEADGGFALGHTGAAHGERCVVEQIPTNALAPATGFWATAGAIATFAGEVFTRGALLAPRSLREMRRRVWTIGEASHYGLGLQEGTIHGFTAIGHSGGFPTGLTRTWAVPDQKLAVSVLGTSIDAPSSELAAGLLGLIALAAGRPNPNAGGFEGPGAGGGGSNGRERPCVLSEQDAVEVQGIEVSASELADLVVGTFDSLWGRSRLARIGDRLFELPAHALDPAGGALELSVAGTRPDPIDPSRTVVRLACWGDAGYGTWAEPLLARLEKTEDGSSLRCTALIDTGQLLVPSDEFTVPERVTAP